MVASSVAHLVPLSLSSLPDRVSESQVVVEWSWRESHGSNLRSRCECSDASVKSDWRVPTYFAPLSSSRNIHKKKKKITTTVHCEKLRKARQGKRLRESRVSVIQFW